MEQLVKKHKVLISNLQVSFRHNLIDNIEWQERLVGIKGARGVGKTTLILQYISENYELSSKCLYVNMEDINFPYKNIVELAEEFEKQGGKMLFIDEIHKQKDWVIQLKNIYDFLPGLKVVFTGSSILELDHSKADLSRRAVLYTMQGLSFREFLQIENNISLPVFSLEDIVKKHDEIVFSVFKEVKPLSFFKEYLQLGYFPFYLQNKVTYTIKLSELINQVIDYDLAYFINTDIEHLQKLKRFLYLLSKYVPVKPNISKLAAEMQISRSTISNYIIYLERAAILKRLFDKGSRFKTLAKPNKLLLDNPNLAFALSSENQNIGSLRETFFVNQLSYKHRVELSDKGDFIIDEKYTFEVGGKSKDYSQIANIENSYLASAGIEIGYKNKIPLWLFGFLY